MGKTMLAAAAVVLGLTGCAAKVVKTAGTGVEPVRIPAVAAQRLVLAMNGPAEVTGSEDWEQFQGAWRQAFKSEAKLAGIAFAPLESNAQAPGEPGTLLSVYVNDYRFLSAGARYGFGIMTGNAYVDAKLRFSDIATGQSFGEQAVNTSSSAWEGVFSAMTEKQVQAIAADVVADMKKR